jgi:HSP20 family protein
MQARVSTAARKPEQSPGQYVSPFRLFDDMMRDWAYRTTQHEGDAWKPPVDILEKNGNLILRAELPGVDEKDIELKLEGAVLTIKGERKLDADGNNCYKMESFYGPFSRSFTIPETVDPEKVSASFKNGILNVVLPQRPEVKTRSIKITA